MMDMLSLSLQQQHEWEEVAARSFNIPQIMDSVQDIIGVPETCPDTIHEPTKLAQLLNFNPHPSLTPPRQVPTQAPPLPDYVPQELPQMFQEACFLQRVSQVLQDTKACPQATLDTQAFPQALQEVQVVPQGPQVRHILQEPCPKAQPLSLPSPGTLWKVPAQAPEEVPQFSPTVAAVEYYHSHSPSPPPSQPLPRQAARTRRGRRSLKEKQPKLYQRQEKFEDPAQEKRRLDAINAKKNRDAKKAKLENLRLLVEDATKMRDTLWNEVETLRQREEELLSRLKDLPYLFSSATLPTTLPSISPVSATIVTTPFPRPHLTPSPPTASTTHHLTPTDPSFTTSPSSAASLPYHAPHHHQN